MATSQKFACCQYITPYTRDNCDAFFLLCCWISPINLSYKLLRKIERNILCIVREKKETIISYSRIVLKKMKLQRFDFPRHSPLSRKMCMSLKVMLSVL